jgi:hypothetical protein
VSRLLDALVELVGNWFDVKLARLTDLGGDDDQ